jgi:alkanesulfonate monooxygenase SsuD/methylene tetrahydromethanopterin reductase-like flavin-dependent oxidoreductase (luciferase family)
VAAYRQEFRPSEHLDRPYVIAGVNAIAADTADDAQQQLQAIRRIRAVGLFGQRGRSYSDAEVEALLESPAGRHVDAMMTHTAVGTRDDVRTFLEAFAKTADADELIVAFQSPTPEQRLRSVTLTAEAMGLGG